MALTPFIGELDANTLKPFGGALGPEPVEPSGFLRRNIADPALSLLKGAVGVPEFVVGVADMATGGQAGKISEDGFGFKPKEAKETISSWQSPELQYARAKVAEADGFVPTVKALVQNPSAIVDTALESAPSMLGGAGVAKGVIKGLPKIAPFVAAAIGEGTVTAGQTAEQVRQESPSGTTSVKQNLIAAGSGALTGMIGLAGGKIAKTLGIGDLDVILAGGKGAAANKNLLRRVAEGAFTEGILEELPQSAQEQVAQNLALNKPWNEGVAKSAASGMIVGGLMGMTANVRPSAATKDETEERILKALAEAGNPATDTTISDELDKMAVEDASKTAEQLAPQVVEQAVKDDALVQALSLEEAPASQELSTPVENLTPPPQVDTSTGELIEENPVIDWLNSLPFKDRNKLIKKATDSPVEAQEYLRRKYEEAVNPVQSEVISNGEKGRGEEVLDQQGADTTALTFTKKSPVPPPDNPAFLTPTSVKEAADGSFEVTQPKAEPVTDKDVPAMLDAISEAYDNGHAMEDYAPENFGKVDGEVKIIDADSMTPLDSPDVVHGSKEELMAAAKNKLIPTRSKVGVEEQFNKEFTAKYLQGGIEASRAEDMVDDYAADPAVQQALDMDEEEAVDYFNSLAEGIKSRSKQAAKSKVKLSAKGQSDGEAGTSRSIRSILASAESDTGGTSNATGGSTPITALQGAGGGVQSAVAPFSLRSAAERLGFLNKTVISKRTGKLYAPGTFRESKDRSLRDRLAEIAGVFGHDVTLMANIRGGDFDGGVAAADKRNIYILESVENPHIAVLGHELVHQIEQNNRPLYVELATAFAELKDDAGFVEYMSRYHKISAVDGKLVVPPDVSEEWVGDVLGLGMTRQSFWDAFYEHSPSLAQRIAQLVKEFLARISGKLNGRIMKSEATIRDFKAVDREASRILKKYAESQKDAGGVDGPEFKRLASEKGTQNEKDKFTASILAGASGEAQGGNLGYAQAELARVVGERVYDGRITSPRARKTVEAKALRAWAKAQGLLNDGSAFETEWRKQTNSEGKRIKGNEHDVIFNGDGTVTKRNHLPGTYHVSYKELFDRVALFNYLFGGDATLTLTGFQDTPDGLLPEFSQKDLGGGVARIEQTEKMLSGAGFEPVGDKTTAYRLPGTDIIITDVFGENTRQVGDVTVPMDYVIFHGERARSWLKSQEKVELPEFDEAEFDKGFDAAMKFSATELAEGKNLAKNVTEWFKSFPYLRVLEDATNTAYRWLMPVDRVVNLAASQKDYTPIKNLLLRYISQKAEKSGYTSSAMNDAHHVNQRIDKAFKTEADQKNLQDLVWKATTYELHADPNRHNDWTAKSWEEAGMLEATGKSLGAALKEVRDAYAKLSPEQKSAHAEMLDLVNQMYHDGRKAELAPFELAYGKELVAKADAYNGSVEAAPTDIKDVLPLVRQVNDRYPTLKGDYMPLMRFGQYAVRTYAVDENGEMGDRTRTEFFENAEDALVYVREINEGSSGLQAKLETRPDVRRDVVNIPGSFLDKLRIAAEKRGFTGEALDSLMQDAEGLRANVLPRTSVVGNKLRREGVEGYNQNVTRVFAAYVRNHASANARLIHGSKIEQTFRDIGNAIDAYSSNRNHDPNAAKNMHLLKDQLYELERSGNNEKINKFTKAVGKMTFVWYLASPSVWAVQWSQPFMTTIPKMAARFGFGTSFGAYTSAAKEYMQGKYSDEKIDEFDRKHEYVGLRIANLIAESREANAAKKKEIDQEIKGIYESFNDSDRKLLVLKVLSHQGMIDLSSAHSLQDLIAGATDGDKLVNKAIEKAAFFMQKSETGSRRAAAVSAFDLAFKDGKGFTAANDYTTDVIRDTLADFSSQNRAAWMRGNTGRILGQFQFFRLHMMGKLIQLSKDVIGGEYQRAIDEADGDQSVINEAKKKRSEARKELSYMIGSSFALAGAGGTPVALALSNTATSALWSALAFMFGDDDDPWDPKRDFEVMVRESMGDVAGGVVLKGLPSLVGADISRRIGMGGMANIISGDPPAGLTGTAKANWYAGRILGPAWGVASDGLRTFDAIKEGDLSTVLSAGSPKVIKDFVKALGVSAKGIQAGGKTILQADDVSPYSIALMLSGINPMDVSLAQEESRYVKNLSTEMSQRRSKLIRDVSKANVDGEDTSDALAAVSKWTATHPKLGITAQELASGIKKERKSRLGLLAERERLVKEGA